MPTIPKQYPSMLTAQYLMLLIIHLVVGSASRTLLPLHLMPGCKLLPPCLRSHPTQSLLDNGFFRPVLVSVNG